MRRIFPLVVFLLLLARCPRGRWGRRRALLVACRDFLTLPDLGNSVSGNLHRRFRAGRRRAAETSAAFPSRMAPSAPSGACNPPWTTHSATRTRPISPSSTCAPTALSSSDDGQVYLMLGDGEAKRRWARRRCKNILSGIQGEKLLIVDACYSGALIGRGAFAHSLLPGSRAQSPASLETPLLADPSIHVLTSASGFLNPVGITTARGSPRARFPTSPARFPAASGFTASPKRT